VPDAAITTDLPHEINRCSSNAAIHDAQFRRYYPAIIYLLSSVNIIVIFKNDISTVSDCETVGSVAYVSVTKHF